MKKKWIVWVTCCLMLLLGTQMAWAETESSAGKDAIASIPVSAGLSIQPSQNIALGSTVTLQGSAENEGGSEAEYRYIYYDGSFWREIASSDHVEAVNWCPKEIGSYLMCYQVISQNQVSNTFASLVVSEPEFTLSGIETNVVDGGAGVGIVPQYDTNVPESNIRFTYMIYDMQKGTWMELEKDSQEPYCEWHPYAGGGYWIHVIARVNGMEEVTHTIGYLVSGASMGDFTMDQPAVQPWTTPVTLRGTVSNPLREDLTYEYLTYDGSYWRSLSKSGTLEPYEYTAAGPGNYLLCFQVYDTDGNVMGQRFLGYSAVELYAEAGNIHLSAGATGGVALDMDASTNDTEAQFRWVYYDIAADQWGVIQDWSSQTSTLWSPRREGGYLIQAEARTRTGEKNTSVIGHVIRDISIDSFGVDRSSPQPVNSPITMTGSVVNDLNRELHYRYIMYDGEWWRELYSSDTLQPFTWTPKATGNYLLGFEVTTPEGKVYQSFVGMSVVPLSTKLTDMTVYTPNRQDYFIMQNAESNDPGLKAEYLIYDLRTGFWSRLPEGRNTYWQPKVSGGYWIHAIITGSDGQVYTNTIGYSIQGYEINSFGFSGRLQAGVSSQLKMSGTNYLNEDYTYTYMQWNGAGWDQLYQGSSPKAISWTPAVSGYYAFCCEVKNQYGYVVDSKTIRLSPSDFTKTGWYYEDGYKFYYINGVKQRDLDGILPPQSSYVAKVNRTTCTVTIYAKDGNNGYIIPVKRFACSVGLPATPTPTGTYRTLAKYRWHELMGPSYGQYCTRIVGGILFHSVAGANMTSYNLNPAEYNRLGSPASHGCVRLCVRDAKWIYDNCKIGMQVTIYDSSNPGPLGQGEVYRITDPSQNWDPTDPNV